MKKNVLLKIMSLIMFINIIWISNVYAGNFTSTGSSNIGNFEECRGQYNGCVSTIGYRYKIISNFSYSIEKVKYTPISIKSYLDKTYVDTPENLDKEIKKGGTLFNTILEGTNVSKADFFYNNYSILIEPYFKIMYDTSSEFSGVASEVAWHILDLVWNKGGFAKYTGFWSVNQLFPCTAFIPYSKAADKYCHEEGNYDHKEDYLKMAYNNPRYGKWVISASDIAKSTGKLTITKTDKDTGRPISGIKFYLEENKTKICTTNSYGKCVISNIIYGDYKLIEVDSSAKEKGYGGGYSEPITINSANKSISVTNTKSCVDEFALYKNNRQERIRMYKFYKRKGFDYRQLLDFTNNNDATTACSEKTCDKSIRIGCLSAVKNYAFNPDDLSCYEETISVGKYTGYCNVNFNLTNYLIDHEYPWYTLNRYSFGSNFKSGQMILKRDEPLIAIGEIVKTCYVYGNIGNNNIISENNKYYYSYVGDLKLNNQKLNYSITKNDGFSKEGNGINKEYETFTKSIQVNYNLKPVYSEIGTGKISYQSCLNCKFLGYGFASKLDVADGLHNAQFDLNVKKTLTPIGSVSKTENACQYTVKNEIIDDKGNLNLEFRVIDTTNPFPGKSGNGRDVGENWCAVNPDLTGEGSVTTADSRTLNLAISNGITSKEFDINRDGEVNDEDWSIIRKLVAGILLPVRIGKDCKSDNYYINYIMKTTNNSYDKNKTGPKYSVMLDRETISKIKQDNKNINYLYDAFDLTCESGENCTDYFLKNILGINKENNIS